MARGDERARTLAKLAVRMALRVVEILRARTGGGSEEDVRRELARAELDGIESAGAVRAVAADLERQVLPDLHRAAAIADAETPGKG